MNQTICNSCGAKVEGPPMLHCPSCHATDKEQADLLPCGHPRACAQIATPLGDEQNYVHYCAWCNSIDELRHWAEEEQRAQYLELQEICHALAGLLIKRQSEVRKLREALDSETALSGKRWGEIVHLRQILRAIRKHWPCNPDNGEQWQAWQAMDSALTGEDDETEL